MNSPSSRDALLLTVVALSLSLVVWGESAWGNGGTPRLSNARAGPYLVSVWSQPDLPRAGELDIGVAVMTLEARDPILDAEVRLTAEPIDRGGTPISVVASRGTGANKLLYHVDLELPIEGRWRVTVHVEGPAGSGSAGFELEVKPPVAAHWPLVGASAVFVILMGIAWRMLRPRRGHSERSS